MIKRILAIVLLLSLIIASGEEVSSERDVRIVYVGQNFTVKVYHPDERKNPDYYYELTDPVFHGDYIKYLGSKLKVENKRKYYKFKAMKRGETDIKIYRIKKGKNSVTGLDYSIKIKIEK